MNVVWSTGKTNYYNKQKKVKENLLSSDNIAITLSQLRGS